MVPSIRALSLAACLSVAISAPGVARADDLGDAIAADYTAHLGELYVPFRRNPELSFQEHATAARLAGELRAAGLEVTGGVGGTGILAIMDNGPGPLVTRGVEATVLGLLDLLAR
jgi:hypothetical protein